MSFEYLSDYYMMFVFGVPVGAFLSGLVWGVSYAIDFLVHLLKMA